MARNRMNPDTALEISLSGTAARLTDSDASVLDAIAELRDLAGGRTDLLARAAGTKIGGYLGSSTANPADLAAAHLLVLAGGYTDHEALTAAADTARANAAGSAYSL